MNEKTEYEREKNRQVIYWPFLWPTGLIGVLNASPGFHPKHYVSEMLFCMALAVIATPVMLFVPITFWPGVVLIIGAYAFGRFVRKANYMSFGYGGDVLQALLFGVFWGTILSFLL